MIDRKDADAAIDWAIKQAAKDKKDKLLPDSIIDTQLKGTAFQGVDVIVWGHGGIGRKEIAGWIYPVEVVFSTKIEQIE